MMPETIAVVIDQHGDPAEAIQTAVDSCPTRALSIVADVGGSGDKESEEQ